jgi:transcriptional regulator with XRE-family HTH domain
VSKSPLRRLREQAGHTQEVVASVVGVAQAFVSSWESGAAPIGEPNLALLTRLYGCTVDELEAAADTTRAEWIRQRDTRLADVLRRRRIRAGLSRQAVAEACDVSPSAVVLWEQGTIRPRRETLVEMAELLGVDAEQLLVDARYTDEEIAGYLRLTVREMTPLAVLLREARLQAGLSQAQVAAVLGTSQNSVSAIETAQFTPDRTALKRLRHLYDIPEAEAAAAYFETRAQVGLVPQVALPWPLNPRVVPRSQWFRQLRAHLGMTRGEFAERLGVDPTHVNTAERPDTVSLPSGLRNVRVLTILARTAGCSCADIIVGFGGERAAEVAHLVGLTGPELVRASANLAEMLTVLNLYGVTWTTMGKAAGTSRQSPINWMGGAIPHVSRVRRLASLFGPDFGPPVSPDELEELWRRTRDGQRGSEPPEVRAAAGQ